MSSPALPRTPVPPPEAVAGPAAAAEGTGTVLVRAVHRLDGAPAVGMNLRLDVPAAVARARTGSGEMPRCGGRARVDAAGDARIGSVPAGDYVLRNDRLDPDQPLRVRAGETLHVEYVVQPGQRIEGCVTNAAGVPISGARIELLAPDAFSAIEHVADSDAAGRFVVRDVHVNCQVLARAEGFQAGRVSVQSLREPKNVRFVLAPGGLAVWGDVTTADGSAVANALVRCDPEGRGDALALRAQSDARGTFRIFGLPAGECGWTAQAPGLSATGRCRAGEPLRIVLAPVVASDRPDAPDSDLLAPRFDPAGSGR